MLGLAARGGNVKSGEYSTEKAIKDHKARLVLVAMDASENTKKSFQDMCRFYGVPYCEYGTKEELGHYIGKQFRASLAVTDPGLAKTVIEKLQSDGLQNN